jgi:hypothetical protein
MALRASFTPMPPDLNAFLFARMGEDKSGLVVTVASAIARSGIDPWQEAARIARLSQSAAIQVLVPMIARSSEVVDPGDARATADHLVSLLPKSVPTESRRSEWKMRSIPPAAIWAAGLIVAVGFLFWTMRETGPVIDQSPAGLSSSDSARNP